LARKKNFININRELVTRQKWALDKLDHVRQEKSERSHARNGATKGGAGKAK